MLLTKCKYSRYFLSSPRYKCEPSLHIACTNSPTQCLSMSTCRCNSYGLRASNYVRPCIQGTFHAVYVIWQDWIFDSVFIVLFNISQLICVHGAGALIKAWGQNGDIDNYRDIPVSGIDLLNHMYAPDQAQRLSITQIREHPYLKQPVQQRRWPASHSPLMLSTCMLQCVHPFLCRITRKHTHTHTHTHTY